MKENKMKIKLTVFFLICASVICCAYSSDDRFGSYIKLRHGNKGIGSTKLMNSNEWAASGNVNFCGLSGYYVKGYSVKKGSTQEIGNPERHFSGYKEEDLSQIFTILAFPRTEEYDVIDVITFVNKRKRLKSDSSYFYEENFGEIKQVKVDALELGYHRYIMSRNKLSEEELQKYFTGKIDDRFDVHLPTAK